MSCAVPNFSFNIPPPQNYKMEKVVIPMQLFWFPQPLPSNSTILEKVRQLAAWNIGLNAEKLGRFNFVTNILTTDDVKKIYFNDKQICDYLFGDYTRQVNAIKTAFPKFLDYERNTNSTFIISGNANTYIQNALERYSNIAKEGEVYQIRVDVVSGDPFYEIRAMLLFRDLSLSKPISFTMNINSDFQYNTEEIQKWFLEALKDLKSRPQNKVYLDNIRDQKLEPTITDIPEWTPTNSETKEELPTVQFTLPVTTDQMNEFFSFELNRDIVSSYFSLALESSGFDYKRWRLAFDSLLVVSGEPNSEKVSSALTPELLKMIFQGDILDFSRVMEMIEKKLNINTKLRHKYLLEELDRFIQNKNLYNDKIFNVVMRYKVEEPFPNTYSISIYAYKDYTTPERMFFEYSPMKFIIENNYIEWLEKKKTEQIIKDLKAAYYNFAEKRDNFEPNTPKMDCTIQLDLINKSSAVKAFFEKNRSRIDNLPVAAAACKIYDALALLATSESCTTPDSGLKEQFRSNNRDTRLIDSIRNLQND